MADDDVIEDDDLDPDELEEEPDELDADLDEDLAGDDDLIDEDLATDDDELVVDLVEEDEEEVVVPEDIRRIKICRMETVCKMRYQEGQERRARVRNLIVPLRYQDDTTPISEEATYSFSVSHSHKGRSPMASTERTQVSAKRAMIAAGPWALAQRKRRMKL